MSCKKRFFHSDNTAEECRRSDRMAREQNWYLCRVVDTDTSALYEVMHIPEVYRYCADNKVSL